MCPRWRGRVFVKQVKIHFSSSLAWNVFGPHKLSYITLPRWHGQHMMYFVCFNANFVIAGIAWVCHRWHWSTGAKEQFVSSLALDEFGQQILRGILYPP